MSSWIKCSDRLPEVSGKYLVFHNTGRFDYSSIDIGSFATNLSDFDDCDFPRDTWNCPGWYWFDTYEDTYEYKECINITHWMPLPEPPKD